jgi:hypothetical protein
MIALSPSLSNSLVRLLMICYTGGVENLDAHERHLEGEGLLDNEYRALIAEARASYLSRVA